MTAKKATLPGLILTALAVLTFAAAAVLWIDRQTPAELTGGMDMRANERQTAANLRLIVEGQRDYLERGFGPGGEQAYATFFTHLWTAVGENRQPVPLDLIPRELAFATGPSTAVAGYWFDDLHYLARADGSRVRMNSNTHWGVFAMPAAFGESGETVFLATADGVWAKRGNNIPDALPHDPAADGWEPAGP